MREELEKIKKEGLEEIRKVEDLVNWEKVRVKYLGRKGLLTEMVKKIGSLPPQERPPIGKLANQVKGLLLRELEGKKESLEGKKEKKPQERVLDVTLPGRLPSVGGRHPITIIIDQMKEIFRGLGFTPVDGPEIETEYYNFEALNFPPEHPARDAQDSFRLGGKFLLRTQTSPVQVRVMEKVSPPLRVIHAGKCFRRDAIDASHLPMFHQVEGLAVDEDVTFADLKGTLQAFVHQMFGPRVRMRFIPSFFPFTEPSAEVAISCIICGGKGCSTCSHKGWLEILGAGMVDPAVFEAVGYDAEKYTGFAFGMGVERIAMLKYGINDIRLFFENDLRFLQQF